MKKLVEVKFITATEAGTTISASTTTETTAGDLPAE